MWIVDSNFTNRFYLKHLLTTFTTVSMNNFIKSILTVKSRDCKSLFGKLFACLEVRNNPSAIKWYFERICLVQKKVVNGGEGEWATMERIF